MEVVYLSPDADEPLDEVLPASVYVVGGIVDRNLSKGLTLGAAEARGARAARLPFEEHLPGVPRGDRVLTVCACVGVLMGVRAGQGWREALEKSVPRRSVEKAARRARRGGAWRGVTVVEGPRGNAGWGVVETGTAARDASDGSVGCRGSSGGAVGGVDDGTAAGDPKAHDNDPP